MSTTLDVAMMVMIVYLVAEKIIDYINKKKNSNGSSEYANGYKTSTILPKEMLLSYFADTKESFRETHQTLINSLDIIKRQTYVIEQLIECTRKQTDAIEKQTGALVDLRIVIVQEIAKK
jgi:BMFP domain-containing protein YqiC